MKQYPWSQTQHERLRKLGADIEVLKRTFKTAQSRDTVFQQFVKKRTCELHSRLELFRQDDRRPVICRLEELLAQTLVTKGFTQVTTPIIMAKGHLAKMTIDDDHDLYRQVFWLDAKRCLRPMLAPHLYYVSRDLLRLWPRPLRIFEIGPCFRKESQGAHHMNEFTMLNLVEYGLPMALRQTRLNEFTALVMAAAGIKDYTIETESSEVYGETMDVLVGQDQLEVASAAVGPHPLDAAWGVMETWVGIGFGLERMVMASKGFNTLKKCGRSLVYLNGTPLNI